MSSCYCTPTLSNWFISDYWTFSSVVWSCLHPRFVSLSHSLSSWSKPTAHPNPSSSIPVPICQSLSLSVAYFAVCWWWHAVDTRHIHDVLDPCWTLLVCYPLCISVLAHFSWLLSFLSNIARPPCLALLTPDDNYRKYRKYRNIKQTTHHTFKSCHLFHLSPPQSSHSIHSIHSIDHFNDFLCNDLPTFKSIQIKVTTHSNPQQQQETNAFHSLFHSLIPSPFDTKNTQSLSFLSRHYNIWLAN